jgi:hypothetical protein
MRLDDPDDRGTADGVTSPESGAAGPGDRLLGFVVRLAYGEDGHCSGIVERVTSRERYRFHDLDALCDAIAAMVEAEGFSVPRRAGAVARGAVTSGPGPDTKPAG